MLCDDVINDKDYVGLKRVTEDRELRKYNNRQEPQTCCTHDAADDPSSTLVVWKLITTRLSVAKCQYYPRYRKITLTVTNLVTGTYLLHRITNTTA